MPAASSGTVSWLIRVPGKGMKNSPMSEASRWAALVLSVSAPANSFRSSRPSRTLVSFGGWAAGSLRRDLRQQRLSVGQLGGVGHLPSGGHDIAEAAGGVVDAARLGCRRWRRWRRRVRVRRRWRRWDRRGAVAARWGRRVAVAAAFGAAGGGGGALGSPAAAAAAHWDLPAGAARAVVPGGGGGGGLGVRDPPAAPAPPRWRRSARRGQRLRETLAVVRIRVRLLHGEETTVLRP